MNKAKLKNYAPQARRDFIQAMMDRAAYYGLTASKIEPVVERGDVAVIAGREYPLAVARKRKKLVDRIQRDGFEQTMEALAYTWFNRLVAIRYMELHGYLDHGYRVLSSIPSTETLEPRNDTELHGKKPEKKSSFRVSSVAFRGPEILHYAEHVELPGLKREAVIDLKLAGNQEAELYRLLLVAQCNALHRVMPFLFERIDDETELLLPDNLLHSDSLLRRLVSNLDEDDCASVEVLGWLYQFYIAERKDQVMARKSAVPTEDIPAVTQLFTPHWIVRYLVENSLGRLWLLNRPGSRLREQMPYYIEGEPETDFLKITRPEDLRLCDPAVGSGHLLTYAFDLLALIYQEEGYAPTEIPALILRHNLHGLEICPRAAQLAGLALVFKAREKSRRFFQPEHLVRPHIIELQNITFAEDELADYFKALGIDPSSFILPPSSFLRLLHQFEEAKNFGSLIQPCLDEPAIASARRAIEANDLGGQLFLRETHRKVLRVLEQAEALTQRYHVVVANPPYMGTKAMTPRFAVFAKEHFINSRSDMSAVFIERGSQLAVSSGLVAMITMQSWMFLSSLKNLRKSILSQNTILNMAHCGARAFDSISGEVVSTTAFVIARSLSPSYRGIFIPLKDGNCEAEKDRILSAATTPLDQSGTYFQSSTKDFLRIPGSPIAYWVSEQILRLFSDERCVGDVVKPRQGMSTNDNTRFLRRWFEVEKENIGFGYLSSELASRCGRKWFPYNKGGSLRKWYGNNEYVVNWRNDGKEIKKWLVNNPKDPNTSHWSRRIINTEFYFKQGITWADITTSSFAARHADTGSLFDVKGSSAFPDPDHQHCLLALMNCRLMNVFMMVLNPTVTFQVGDIARVPFVRPSEPQSDCRTRVNEMVSLARADWDNFETSWDFRDLPLLRPGLKGATLEASWRNWEAHCTATIRRMQELETENNRLFIAAYGLEGELQPEVPEEQITLARADTRRDMAALLSYAIGCMMGRYRLDQPGLIYAHSGNVDFEKIYFATEGHGSNTEKNENLSSSVSFPCPSVAQFLPDEDGIIPMLDGEWFEDDIVARTREFLRATFGEATLNDNLRFIEESLGKDLRKYFLTDFYKDHLQTYKKRPIYWLFSSGKQRAFQCLVYLHRYHQGTLARMRTEYAIPLQGRIAARIEQLDGDKAKATSTSFRKKLQKEQDDLKKQQAELAAFEEKLKHAADQKIHLDLDDGVKVNYRKFGDLLAESKAITGGKEEE